MSAQAVLYCRYSSHAQRDVSIDQQVAECRQFAKAKDLEIVRVFADHAVSGTTDRRPEFQRMIAEAPSLGVQYVIVYALDRFARDRYDSAVYKRQLREAGIRVISATEPITDDPVGVLMESMLEGWGEYYSKEHRRKVSRGLQYNAEHCMANGPLPYGYRRAQDGKVAVDDAAAPIVREIFTRVASGEPFAEILRDLNARGLKTSTGHTWTNSSFNAMLSNERYLGVYKYGDVRIEGGMPAIVDRAVFDAVQHRLRTKKNPRAPQKRRRESGVYLLTGKIFCGRCGSPMVGTSGTGRHGELHYYYACKGRKTSGCTRRPLVRDAIENEVAAALRQYVLTDEIIVALADAAVARQARLRRAPILDARRADLAKVQRSIRNIVAAIEKGIIADATQQRLAQLEKEERELLEHIASDEYILDQTFTREEYIALLKLYQEGDIRDKRFQEALFDAFLIAVYVYDDHLKIKFAPDNHHDEDVTIPLSEAPRVRIDHTEAHHSTLIRTGDAVIVAIGRAAFLLTCPRK